MDTRRVRRWLLSHDPLDVLLLVGDSAPEDAASGETAAGRKRFGRRRAAPTAVAVTVPSDAELEAADLLDLLGCARRVDVVLPDGHRDGAQAAGSGNDASTVSSDGEGSATLEPRSDRAAIEALVAYAAELAAMCGRAGDIGVVNSQVAVGVPTLDPDRVPVGRRALIGAPDTPLPEPAQTAQRRLVDAVSALLAASGLTPADLDGEPSPSTGSARLRARGCCGDGLCTRVCPNDALHLEVVQLETALRTGPPGVGAPPKAQSQFRLMHVATDCDGCGVCIEMCPHDALAQVGEHPWSELLKREQIALRTGWVRACTRCGAAHRQPGDLCAVCTAHQENPFAVRLPPGVTF